MLHIIDLLVDESLCTRQIIEQNNITLNVYCTNNVYNVLNRLQINEKIFLLT